MHSRHGLDMMSQSRRIVAVRVYLMIFCKIKTFVSYTQHNNECNSNFLTPWWDGGSNDGYLYVFIIKLDKYQQKQIQLTAKKEPSWLVYEVWKQWWRMDCNASHRWNWAGQQYAFGFTILTHTTLLWQRKTFLTHNCDCVALLKQCILSIA